MLVLGIDEAGRGPALGAMVLAAVVLDTAGARRLTRAGVVDSKSFGAGPRAHEERTRLVGLIERTARWIDIEVCDVDVVDAYASQGKLNVLEQECAERLLRRAPDCHRIVADGKTLFSPLRDRFPLLEARNNGESVHTAVAAASVCAKVRRDDLFACIAARYETLLGPVGGLGYANAATRAFTRRYIRMHGHLPPEARISWPWRGSPRPHPARVT